MKIAVLYPPVDTAALSGFMAAVGPASEWSWFDYLSQGDVLRLVRLRQIIDAPDTSADVATAAAMAFAEIGRVAQERLAKARVPTSDAPVDPIVLAARAKVLEIRKLYESVDSDYCAGVKETCDAIGEVLGMGTTDQIAENDPANASKRVAPICPPPVVGPQPPAKPLDGILEELRERLADLKGHLKDTPAYDYKEFLDIERILAFAEQQRAMVLL